METKNTSPILNSTSSVQEPLALGSYLSSDVTFLLKELTGLEEKDSSQREEAIQNGAHYSELLPQEYRPSSEYVDLFHKILESQKQNIADLCGVLTSKIRDHYPHRPILISLARAGTPVGVLLKRYAQDIYQEDWPHYSISIIRDKGIDENALLYIQKKHPNTPFLFVDGWTGKGAITKELNRSIGLFNTKHKTTISSQIAVLADPGHCANFYGTRLDQVIPSACLNCTISGLLSRTILRKDLIGPQDFHGTRFYREFANEDLSLFFIESVQKQFSTLEQIQKGDSPYLKEINSFEEITFQGMKDVQNIQERFGISSFHFIKPGVGETTRVLLRRIPWKILIHPKATGLEHILQLASDRNIEVLEYSEMNYACCGLIKDLKK